MSNVIPGAEFAPIVVWTRKGYREPTTKELARFHNYQHLDGSRGAIGALIFDGEATHARRLSCTDPDDMRAIWYRAALALGASEVEAATAVLLLDHHGRHLTIASLGTPRRLWTAPADSAYAPVYATAALCLHVWGPK